MSVDVYIGATQIVGANTNVKIESLFVETRIATPPSASLTLQSLDGTFYRPQAGEPLVIYENGVVIFGGPIKSGSSRRRVGTDLLYTDIQAFGFRALADKRLTGERFGTNGYYNMKANDIMRDLVTNCMAADGIIITGVTAGGGPDILSAEFNYATVAEAFDKVCELAGGYFWDIDGEKNLRFFAPTSGSTVLTIANGSGNILRDTLSVDETLEQYANKVVVKVGRATSAESESFDGSDPDQPTDGARQEWTMALPLFSAPTVTVDGNPETVGVANVDTGVQWYWQQGSSRITQDSGETPLANTSTVVFDYVGEQQIQVFAQNPTEISARAAIEGTSGVYERIYEATTPTATSDAQALADSILDIYDEPSYLLKAAARSIYLDEATRVGDKVVQSRTDYETGDYFIRAIRFFQHNLEWRREIEAVKGPILQDGFQFWRGLSGSAGGSGVSVAASGGGGGTSADSAWFTIAYAGTISPALSNGRNQQVTLGGSPTINIPSGATGGEYFRLLITNDSTPGRTVTLPSGWKSSQAIGYLEANGRVLIDAVALSSTEFLIISIHQGL